jgi:16S rRNA (guanine966-N2)-methyltransferase
MRIIAGRWKGHRLKPIRGRSVRPTTDRVREAWMSSLGGTLDGLDVLDLFAGSGALGLEALSRGARHVVFVECARGALRVLEGNVEVLDAGSSVTVVAGDVFRYVRGLHPFQFDVALADPPYGEGHALRLAGMFRTSPFARELWVEHPWRESIPAGPSDRTRRYGDIALTTLIAEAPT